MDFGAKKLMRRWVTSFAIAWEHPMRGGVLALLIYALIAAYFNPALAASKTAYFNYLADAFLHGQ